MNLSRRGTHSIRVISPTFSVLSQSLKSIERINAHFVCSWRFGFSVFDTYPVDDGSKTDSESPGQSIRYLCQSICAFLEKLYSKISGKKKENPPTLRLETPPYTQDAQDTREMKSSRPISLSWFPLLQKNSWVRSQFSFHPPCLSLVRYLYSKHISKVARVEEGKLVLGKSETNIISPYLHLYERWPIQKVPHPKHSPEMKWLGIPLTLQKKSSIHCRNSKAGAQTMRYFPCWEVTTSLGTCPWTRQWLVTTSWKGSLPSSSPPAEGWRVEDDMSPKIPIQTYPNHGWWCWWFLH
jgi:hypothetical protein